jgi:hypothetical protein
MNTARNGLAGAGTTNSSFSIWWLLPPSTGATEEYDGTSWTTSPASLNTARYSTRWSRNTNSSFRFGGYIAPTVTAATEEWTGAGSPTTVTITAS